MTMVADNIEADTRERILVVAERLFREIGYQKTTVADIAKVLRMSPANVYRFFDSKKAIHEGVARGLMGEVEDAAQAIASGPGPAARRLRELMTTIHRMNSERYVGNSKLHEMVEIAMQESWDVCVAHMERITGTIAEVIASGAASGEFEAPDVPLAAMCSCTAMMRFFHPQMIAQCADKPGPSIDQMIDFVLAGLAPKGNRHCERSEAIQSHKKTGLLRRSAPRNDGNKGKSAWTHRARKTCISTSRKTATACGTIRSMRSSRRARSAGFRRAIQRAISTSRPTASSTASATIRRSSAFPPPPGRTASSTSRRPASSSGISRPRIWRSR